MVFQNLYLSTSYKAVKGKAAFNIPASSIPILYFETLVFKASWTLWSSKEL